MKSIPSLGPWVSVSAFLLACSSANSNDAPKAGAGGSNDSGGSASGGRPGSSGGGSGNTATTGGASNASGGRSAGGARSTGGNSAGGTDSGPGNGGTSPQAGGDSGANVDGSNTDGSTSSCQANFQSDPLNCGHCGKSCAGGECFQGLCQPVLVLDAQEEPYRPGLDGYAAVVHAGKVYEWEYTTTSAVHYVVQSALTTPTNPASQGTSVQDVPSDPSIDAVTFDGAYIYEAIEHAAGVQGEVARKKLDGSENKGAATKLFSLPADLKWENVAVASDAIYVTGTTMLNSSQNPVPDKTTFYRMALPVANASLLPTPILANRTDTISDLTVISNQLFWLESYGLVDWRLTTAPTTGGTAVEIDGDVLASTSSIATDGNYVYWTTINDLGELKRCPLSNLDAAHAQHVADLSSAQEGIFIQGHFLYAMELVDRATFRIDTNTGTKELLGQMQVPPSQKGTRIVGVEAGFLYMTTLDAKIWRFPSVP